MKQSESPNIMLSVATLLKSIHDETVSGNNILRNIENNITDYFSNAKLSVSSLLNNQLTLTSNIIRQNNVLSQINVGIYSISAMLAEFFDINKKKTKQSLEPTEPTEIINKENNQDFNIPTIDLKPVVDVLNEIKNILLTEFTNTTNQDNPIADVTNKDKDKLISKLVNSVTNTETITEVLNFGFEKLNFNTLTMINYLNQLTDILQNIYTYLPNLTGQYKDSKVADQRSNDFIKLAESIGNFAKNIDKEFINNFKEFVTIYEQFIDEKNGKRLLFTNTQINALGVGLKIFALYSESTANIFNRITKSLFKLTLFLVMPLFNAGLIILITGITKLKAAIGNDKTVGRLVFSVNKLSTSLLKIAFAMILIAKIDMNGIFKFIFALAALTGALSILTGGKGKKNKSYSVNLSGIFSAALGITMLVLAIAAVNDINFSKTANLVIFLGTLAITLRAFKALDSVDKNQKSIITSLSWSLTLMIISLSLFGSVNWTGPLMLISFILGLGVALLFFNKLTKGGGGINITKIDNSKKFKKNNKGVASGLFGFAFGLAILVLAIDAVNEVNWGGTVQLILFITAIGLAMKTMGGKNAPGKMVQFSIGIGMLVLIADASNSVNWIGGLNLILFILGITFAFKQLCFSRIKPKNILAITGAMSLSLVMLTIAVSLFSKVNLNVQQVATTVLFLIGYTLLLQFMSKNRKPIMQGVVLMKLMSISMLIMSGALFLIGLTTINLIGIMTFFGIVILSMGLCVLLYTIDKPVKKGAKVLKSMAASLLVAAVAVWMISNIIINPVGLLIFFGVVAIMTAALFGLSYIFVPVLFGALGLITISAATLVSALTIFVISQLSYPKENIADFMSAVAAISIGFFNITPQIILGTIGAVLFVAIAVSSLLTATLFLILSGFKINTENIDSFGIALKSLANAYDELGIVSLGKSVIKAGMILPIIGTSLLAATFFEKLSELKITETSVDNFTNVLKIFVSKTTEAINESVDGLKAIKPGLSSLEKIINISSQLVDVVQAFAELKIGEYEIDEKTGQLKLVRYKQIDDTMLAGVGHDIGKLLQGLLEPLNIMASDDDEWNFNGTLVKNPFGKRKKNKGLERIKNIGESFSALTTVLKDISGNQLLTADEKTYKLTSDNYTNWIGLLVKSVNDVSVIDTNGLTDRGKEIAGFFEALNSITLPNNESKSITESISSVMNELSDNVKWSNINSNLESTNKNVEKLVSNINKIDIEKATALEKNLKLFTEAKTVEGIQQCIEKLGELIGLITVQQEKQTVSQSKIASTISNVFGGNKEEKTIDIPVENKNNKQTNQQQPQQDVSQMLATLNDTLNNISEQLNSTIKVKNVNEDNLLLHGY